MEVGFSDSRFLRRVLAEAQRRGGATDEAAINRLERMGFSTEVARVSLHVAQGDERRALELCMSGMAFSGPQADEGGAFGDKACDAPGGKACGSGSSPQPLACHICGHKHVHKKSLEFHLKVCRKRFEQREAKLPPEARRPLLEADELPPGVSCLEVFYELERGPAESPNTGSEKPTWSIEGENAAPTNHVSKPKGFAQPSAQDPLRACEFCKRTFNPGRLEKHQQVCVMRPKDVAPPHPSRRRTSRGDGGASGAASPAAPGAPDFVARAYNSFCQQLERCSGCHRQFRPELLAGHMKKCEAVQAAAASAPASVRIQARRPPKAHARAASPSGYASPTAASGARRRSVEAAASTQASPASTPAPPPPRGFVFAPGGRRTSSVQPGARRSTAGGGRPGSGTPGAPPPVCPAALAGGGGGAGSFVASGASTPVPGGQRIAVAPPSQEASSPPTEDVALILLEKGMLQHAAEKDVEILRAQLVGHLPQAEMVAVYSVAQSSQTALYEAMRTTMQADLQRAEGAGATVAECELWHGTSWETVPKILRHGFNRSFAGRHGTLLGAGTYFSTDLSYSHRFCDRKGAGPHGTKVVLLARVLVGRFCRGASTDVEPPVRDPATGERFDSTVDNEERPTKFAVFRDFQALPLLALEFRC